MAKMDFPISTYSGHSAYSVHMARMVLQISTYSG